MLNDVLNKQIFGLTVAYVWVIEFQKRGWWTTDYVAVYALNFRFNLISRYFLQIVQRFHPVLFLLRSSSLPLFGDTGCQGQVKDCWTNW
jgi:hypothetical protein